MDTLQIVLPQLFPLMNERDIVEIMQWHIRAGEVIAPGETLLVVQAPGRRIVIPTPPEMTVPHRVVDITPSTKITMGDWLVTLTPHL